VPPPAALRASTIELASCPSAACRCDNVHSR
jgi:hypothetical protein